MTTLAQGSASSDRRPLVARAWSAIAAAWGAFTGVLPHVLHHVGPLAGAALLAGTGGRVLFFAIGLVAAVPFLRRLHRRFRTWVAPATAVVVFALMFTVSTLLIAPLLTGSDSGAKPRPPGIQAPSGHAAHHGN